MPIYKARLYVVLEYDMNSDNYRNIGENNEYISDKIPTIAECIEIDIESFRSSPFVLTELLDANANKVNIEIDEVEE